MHATQPFHLHATLLSITPSAGSSDDDSFYDRTAPGARGSGGGSKKGKGPGGHGGPKQEVEDAASLWGKKEALQEERQRLALALQREEAEAAASGGGGAGGGGTPAAAAAPAQEDSLDAFMSGAPSFSCDLCMRCASYLPVM